MACKVIDSYELSSIQAGMLFHALSREHQSTDNQQVAVFLSQQIDETVFVRAWQRLIERHSVLRTRFRWEGVVEPMQEVVDHARIPVEKLDWRDLPKADRDLKFQTLVDQDRNQGFDLRKAPLLRLKLVRVSESEHYILLSFHHSICDGWGTVLILQEVFAFYEAFQQSDDPDIALPRSYREYIEWLRTLDEESAKDFWQKTLAGFRTPNTLVVARKRGSGNVTIHRGSQQRYLDAALTSALKKRAREASVTLNTLVQGAWGLLLHRYSGETDIVFGATRACRRSALGGAEDMVGLFINTLPFRVHVDPDAELATWLQQLRAQQVVLRDYEHTPLVLVQSWSEVPPGTPLFESILVFDNRTFDEQMRALGGAWAERRFAHYRGETNYPLTLAANGGRELFLEILYSTRFDDDVITRMVDHLQVLLEGMATTPTVKLRDLPLLPEYERHQLLVEWNDTKTDYPCDKCVHELFELQADRTPEAVAVVFEDERLSYHELNVRANQLAHYLIGLGVGPETLVGICVERSLEMVVGLLGILKAGGAYVPLDPGYPVARLAFMLEDTASSVLLTQAKLRERLPEYAGRVISLDTDWGEFARENEKNPKARAGAHNLAYVMYTSGSTGKPKGACIEHRSVVRLVKNTSYIELGPDEVLLQFAPISFDASTFELWGSLLNGARLVVCPTGRPSLEKLGRMIREFGVSTLWLTASLFHQMVDTQLESLRGVRQILAGGETLSISHVRRMLEVIGKNRLINGYGPTENTTFSCCHVMTANTCIGDMVPIGRPIANTTAYVLDSNLRPVPIGVSGELYLGGDGVAREYLNRSELTAEKFIADPFSSVSGAGLYKSGDLVRYLPDGNIEFLGRMDHQVKVRGYRIELGEIEASIARHDAVQAVVVLAREDDPGDKRLVAYVVMDEGAPAELVEVLCAHLRTTLPEYMVPAHFVRLDTLPLTPNGKVDRAVLPAPERSGLDGTSYVAPRTSVEEILAGIWAEVLGVERVGMHDNFFQLGGDSLSALLVVSRVRLALEAKLEMRELFGSPTVASLSISLDRMLSKKVTRVANELTLLPESSSETNDVGETRE